MGLHAACTGPLPLHKLPLLLQLQLQLHLHLLLLLPLAATQQRTARPARAHLHAKAVVQGGQGL